MYQRSGGLVVCRAALQRKHHKAAASASRQRRGASHAGAADVDERTGTTAFLTLQGFREKSSAYRYNDSKAA